MDMDIRRPRPVPPPAPKEVVTHDVPPPVEPTSSSKHSVWKSLKHHWLTFAFILGFVMDNLTLNRVDQVFDNVVLALYVVLAMVSMLLLYAGTAAKLPGRLSEYARSYSPFVMQYAFGGLLSGMLIFYGRSGAWGSSWPYLAIIMLAIYGNETIKDRTTRLLYNLAILFVGVFSYIVLLIPVLTGLMGPWIFVGSGLVAVFLISLYIRVLTLIIPRFMQLERKAIVFVLGIVYLGFNVFYFANIIPPIPLSLKSVGIYNSVVRFENGDYQVKYEEGEWWRFWKDSDTVVHTAGVGQSIYCYAEVFAPTKLSTDIVHVWEYKDPVTDKWEEHARLGYSIEGGRATGYRGYTFINGYESGSWRCSVETERGQVLGRERFEIDTTTAPGDFITEVR